jgi:hypothetical protein
MVTSLHSVNFMAKLLTANEKLNKLDPKLKKDLQEKFHKEQKQRREGKLKKQTNIIRQLLHNGGTTDDIEAALDALQSEDEDEQHADPPQESSDSDK